MSTLLTTNFWRHFQPVAFKYKYGVKPNTYVYVDLTIELVQGADVVSASDTIIKKMGYLCNYVIDYEPLNGKIIQMEDGRGFFYEPDEDFKGEDFLSYRIINSMGQISEPKCIYFIVNHSIKENGRIIEEIIKLDTIILHNGNSDTYYESLESAVKDIERQIYAFNIIPNKWYALTITGSYGDAWGYYAGLLRNWKRKIEELIGIYKTSENSEFEVLKFNTPFSEEVLYALEVIRTGFDPRLNLILARPFMELNFVLSPLGDARLLAKDSNALPIKIYDPKNYTTYGLPFPEDVPKVDDAIAKRITKSNVEIDLINANNKRKLLMLVNGKDIVALSKQIPLNYIDVSTTNLSHTTIPAPIMNIKYINHNHVNHNREIYYTGNTYPTNIVSFTVSIANIARQASYICLLAHVGGKSAVYTNTNYHLRYLKKNDSGEYELSEEYSDFVLIGTPFYCEDKNYDNKAADTIQYEFGMTSNVEYLSKITDVYFKKIENNYGLGVLPIDMSKLIGFVAVPLKGTVENNSIMSNYVPVNHNSVDNFSYKPISSALYNVIYQGESDMLVYTSPEMRLYNKPTIQIPDVLLTLTRVNDYPFIINWKIIDLTSLLTSVPNPSITDIKNHIIDNQESVVDLSKVNYLDSASYCLEYTYSAETRVFNSSTSADIEEYPEVVSIHIRTDIDNWVDNVSSGIYSKKIAVLLELDRNGYNQDILDVKTTIYDCWKTNKIYSKSINFDLPANNQLFYLGLLSWDETAGIQFEPKLQI